MTEEPDDDEDTGDLRRRTFLERHDWIPWVVAAAAIGGLFGLYRGR